MQLISRSSTARRALSASAAVGILTVGLAAPDRAAAQQPSEMVDGIIAVVDDTAVLLTELQNHVIQLQYQGMRVPEDVRGRREFYRQALEQKVNEVLLYVHANREGVTVPETQVEDAVESQLANVKRRFDSELEFQQALAAQSMTEAEFRIQLTEQARTALVSRTYLQQKVGDVQPIPVGDDEIADAFEAQRRALGPKPAMISLKQVIIAPTPSETARLAAEEEARQALSRARAGEDFGRLAREFSDDPASRTDGSVGWVRRGQFLAQFEDALFTLRPGQISDIVETVVGLHIIKLERVRGNERLASHILIRPEITQADVDRARELAQKVAAELRGGADIDSLINLYHDPNERSSLTDVARDRLPADFRDAVEGAGEGDVVGPIELSTTGPIPTKFSVVQVLRTSSAGEWTLDDWRERLRQQIQENKMIDQVVQDLRESTYIDVREEMLDAIVTMPPAG